MEPVKPPVELAVMVPGFVAIGEPSNDMVTTELATKLLPEMFIVVPVGPLVGFSVIAGVTAAAGMVNCAVAEFVDESVALTVCVPAADDGTVMEPVKLPVESVVTVAGAA